MSMIYQLFCSLVFEDFKVLKIRRKRSAVLLLNSKYLKNNIVTY